MDRRDFFLKRGLISAALGAAAAPEVKALDGGCRPSALAVQDEGTPQLLDLGRQTDGSSFRSRLRVRENDAGWRPQLIEGESLIEEAVLSKIKVLGGIG